MLSPSRAVAGGGVELVDGVGAGLVGDGAAELGGGEAG